MNNPNSFFLDDKNVLFFNIFIKNNKLYLITPLNKNQIINKSTIKIIYNSNELICVEQITKAQYEPTQILIYNFEQPKNETYKIKVNYNKNTNIYNLKHIETIKNKKLALTTLFQTDYKLNKLFYDYYKKQGVEHFYMYYNGKIIDEIKQYYDKEDITLIEWDYTYWNINASHSRHYAQLGQMHDAIYRFGKDQYEYILFCDLDEYIYLNDNKKLIDLVSDTSVDTFGFRNIWSNSINLKVPEKFLTEFKIANKEEWHRYRIRSKCIHKMDSVVHVGIHFGTKFKSKNINLKDDNFMFHFHSWGGERTSREKTPNVINLDTFKF